MTGTAATEAEEFVDIYKLDVVEIPTNVPVVRIDDDDEVYRTADEKYDAIVDQIERLLQARPADPGRHRLDREVRAAGRMLKKHGTDRLRRIDGKATAKRQSRTAC